MKKTLLLSLLFILSPIVARAATCDAGYFLDGNNCKLCNNIRSGPEIGWCPGDDTKHPCPHTDTDYEAEIGLSFDNEFMLQHASSYGEGIFIESSTTDFSSANICRNRFLFKDGFGNKYAVEGGYHSDTGKYDNNLKGWVIAADGFYLSVLRYIGFAGFSSAYDYVLQCDNPYPANAHYSGPGTPDVGNCPWECDDGYGLTDAGTCAQLCTAGITTFNSSTGMRLNVYAAPGTEHALRVMVGDTICYVNSATGYGTNTMHIDYNGTVYHLIN